MVGIMKFYITDEDILDKLSKEDREKYNNCFFVDVSKSNLGREIEVTCIVTNDKNEENLNNKDYCRYKLFDDGEISLDIKEE